jgi:DNA-binding transcriptional ArsR family regulator
VSTEVNNKIGIDRQLVHLVASPARIKTLVVLVERTASPKEIADEIGETLRSVSYQVKELLKLGLIEPVRVEPRRGAVAHFYRATIRPIWSDAEWAELSIEERQRFAAWTLSLVNCDVAEALEARTFNARPDAHSSRTPFYVDERGWKEINEIQNEALERSLEVGTAAAQRLAENGEQGIHGRAVMLCIEMPPPRRRREG